MAAIEEIAARRKHQIDKGYTTTHDMQNHNVDWLVKLAGHFLGVCPPPFATTVGQRKDGDGYYLKENLVEAGAFIAAAIDLMEAIE